LRALTRQPTGAGLSPRPTRGYLAEARDIMRAGSMLLARCTWQEVERYLLESRGILLPIGSTEQHGPNGLIGTDALCAELIAQGVGEATGAMVAPTLGFGMAQHHMAFAGTMTLRPKTLLAVLVDLLGSLARHGFERCLVINGHGGNMATIMTAFSELHAAASLAPGGQPASLRCRLRNWWSPPVVAALQKELFGERDGSHATASEISVTQYALPDSIKRAALEPARAPASTGFTDAADFRRRYPDGRIGSDPSLATPEHGERLYRAAVDALAEDYHSFLAES
jgi:creatinine amidohydrolase